MKTTASEIRLVSIGEINREILEYLALTLSSTFSAPCRNDARSINPEPFYHARRRQYHSSQILAELLSLNVSTDTKILGVCEVDLFIPIFTFVFGEAQVSGPAAVMSAHRLSQEFYGLPEDNKLFLGRCEKEATHELGHAFGLVHCPHYECVMHFSNSIEQVDIKQSAFCPTCLALLADISIPKAEFVLG